MAPKPQVKSILDHQEDTVSYIAYDLSIVDIEERRKQAIVYPSGLKLANDLGIKQPNIKHYINPLDKKRVFSKKKQKYFAIRLHKSK